MNELQFSFDLNQLEFKINDQTILWPQGLNSIESESARSGCINPDVIEQIRCEIKKLFQQIKIEPRIWSNVHTSDNYMYYLVRFFLGGQTRLHCSEFQYGLKQLIRRTAYHVDKVGSEYLHIFVYFVLVVEMIDHLKIPIIEFKLIDSTAKFIPNSTYI